MIGKKKTVENTYYYYFQLFSSDFCFESDNRANQAFLVQQVLLKQAKKRRTDIEEKERENEKNRTETTSERS